MAGFSAFGLHRQQRNWGARVREVTYLGMRLIELENELLRIGVLAGKGTDIVEWNYKPRDLDLTWLTAGGVRNPLAYHSSNPDPIATFTDVYSGGWQEVFPNGGVPSEHAGARFGQHGEVSALPWDVRLIADTEEEVGVGFAVRTQKTPYRIEKELRLRAGDPSIHILERITNESEDTLRAMWGHHIALGPPFLDETSQIRVPEGLTLFTHPGSGPRRVVEGGRWSWPMAEDASGGAVDLSRMPPPGTPSEMLYLEGFGDEAWYEVEHPGKGIRLRVEWDPGVMPFLWYWMEFGAGRGYPWYGRHYNVGLEPFSSWSRGGLGPAVENGTALSFGPCETKEFWLRANVQPITE